MARSVAEALNLPNRSMCVCSAVCVCVCACLCVSAATIKQVCQMKFMRAASVIEAEIHK